MDLLRRIARLASALLLLVAGPACADPADIAAAVRFLVSPDAGFVTGQVVAVNGGFRRA